MYKIPNLINLDEEEFISAFVIIPPEVDTLDLSMQIYSRASYQMAEGFRSLPTTVISIHINTNILGLREIEELKEMARGLPPTVKKLCLRNNGFNFPVTKFQSLFHAMPHITHVELQERDEDLKQIGSAEEIASMFASFEKKIFILHGNSSLVEKIKEHYSQIMKTQNTSTETEPNEKTDYTEDNSFTHVASPKGG